ncbi:hypothetical protein VP217E381_P0055 [Vibrio phage 217E38-1]|nr:hypothetical protein VP217E381_P0055 [Vibrio phage 217E38-1]
MIIAFCYNDRQQRNVDRDTYQKYCKYCFHL